MDWKKIVNRTIEYIFCGITAVQILLGLIWTCCQFPHMQNWQETYEYLDISQTWVIDEYVSFLYPLLLKICTGIESVTGMPFYIPVYVIQLAVAVWTSWYFARTVLRLEKRNAIWAAGYLVSFPLLLQFHMSVRVESLCISGVLLLIVALTKVKNEANPDRGLVDIKNTACAFLTTALLIWLLPDMVVICGVVWVVFLIDELLKMRKQKKQKGFVIGCIAFVLALVLGLSVNALVQNPGSRGRIQKTFWSAAFQRVVTDYYSKSFGMWDEDVKALMTIEEALEYAKRSDRMVYEIGPMLENTYGRERANELYQSMTLTCFRLRTRMVVYQIRDDLMDAALMPFSTLWQDNGERMSQTGWNYGRFRENATLIAGAFWNYSIISLFSLIVLGFLKAIISRAGSAKIHYVLAAAIVQCLWNVLSTGDRISYTDMLFVILFWCILGVNLCLGKSKGKEI